MNLNTSDLGGSGLGIARVFAALAAPVCSAFAAAAAVQATAWREPDCGPARILAEIALPGNVPVGERRYGLEYHESGYAGCQENGWYAPRKEAALRLWYDENGDGKQDPAEIRTVQAQLFQRAVEGTVQFDTEENNRNALEALRTRDQRMKLAQVGDTAVAGAGDYGAWSVEAVRGPLRVRVVVRSHAAVPQEMRISGYAQERIQWSRYNRPDEMQKSLSSAGGPKWRYLDWEGAAGAFRALEASNESTALEIARSIVRAWDGWSNRRPEASAPGVKGLYNPDMSPYWPRPAELPEGVVQKSGSRLPEGRRAALSMNLASKDGRQSYDVRLECFPLQREDLYADGPVRLAAAELHRWATQEFVSYQDNNPVRSEIELKGADEAVRLRLPYGDRIAFRCVNVVAVVSGSANGNTPPPRYATEEIARLVLAKLLNDRSSLPEARSAHFSLRQKDMNEPLVADGKTGKLLRAECRKADGTPAAGVRVALDLDDSALPARGRLSVASVVTDPKGVAEFTYTPPDLPTGYGERLPRVVIRGLCTLGEPAEVFADELTLGLDPRKELKLKLALVGAQVLDTDLCQLWVIGKPAVLRVKIDWEPAEIESVDAEVAFTYRGREIPGSRQRLLSKWRYNPEELRRFKDKAYAFVMPEGGPGPVTLGVEVTPLALKSLGALNYSCAPQKAETTVTLVEPATEMRVRFVPLAVASWAEMKNIDPDQWRELRESCMAFLRGIMPLPPERIRDITTTTATLEPTASRSENITGIQRVAMFDRLQELHRLSATGAPGYEYIAGVYPEDWIADEGLQLPSRPNVVVIKATRGGTPGAIIQVTYPVSLSHEIGHHFGFDHPGWGNVWAARGAWIDGNKQPVTRPREYERFYRSFDFMHRDLYPAADTWIAGPEYRILLQRLTR